MNNNPNPSRPAVFFDRDGTLIASVDYLSRPEDVRLLPDAADALRRLRDAGFACVVVTNQPAVGKGMITEADLEQIHAVFRRCLTAKNASIDAIYFCPLAGIGKDPTLIEFQDRKPGPGMLQRAARDLNLDISASWMVGDSVRDILAGKNAGCRGLFLISPQGPTPPELAGVDYHIVTGPLAAANEILKYTSRQRGE